MTIEFGWNQVVATSMRATGMRTPNREKALCEGSEVAQASRLLLGTPIS
jgi:hypothetical protein